MKALLIFAGILGMYLIVIGFIVGIASSGWALFAWLLGVVGIGLIWWSAPARK